MIKRLLVIAALLACGFDLKPVDAQTAIPVWTCPSGVTNGQAFTSPTAAVSSQPCAGAGLTLPTTASFIATQTQASGYKEFWELGSSVARFDNLWNGKQWIQANTVTIAPAGTTPPVTPPVTPPNCPVAPTCPTAPTCPAAPVCPQAPAQTGIQFTVAFACANPVTAPVMTSAPATGGVTYNLSMTCVPYTPPSP